MGRNCNNVRNYGTKCADIKKIEDFCKLLLRTMCKYAILCGVARQWAAQEQKGKKMKPNKDKIKQWQAMREDNNHSRVLYDMSVWYAMVSQREEAWRYAHIFAGINLIHNASGSIPHPIYDYRYATMSAWLDYVRAVEPELVPIFHACL